MAQVFKEAFIKDIQENLYQGAQFVKYSQSHDAWVDNKTVRVPQAGGGLTVTVNRSSLPATVDQRTDDALTYNLDEFTTNPIVIPEIEKVQLSYDKRMSVMKNHIDLINEKIGTYGAYNLSSTATGGANSLTLRTGLNGTVSADKKAVGIFPSLVGNGTGYRYSLGLGDIAAAAAKLDRDNVPQTGRYCVLPSDMYWDFVNNNLSLLGSSLYKPKEELLSDGVVLSVYGFNIFQRPTVSVWADSGPTLAAVGAATVTTSCLGAFFWQDSCVAKAQGAVKFFAREDDPAYYGSYYSALVYFKNTVLRKDCKGVVNMVQAYSAS